MSYGVASQFDEENYVRPIAMDIMETFVHSVFGNEMTNEVEIRYGDSYEVCLPGTTTRVSGKYDISLCLTHKNKEYTLFVKELKNSNWNHFSTHQGDDPLHFISPTTSRTQFTETPGMVATTPITPNVHQSVPCAFMSQFSGFYHLRRGIDWVWRLLDPSWKLFLWG